MEKALLENLYFRSLQFKPSKADSRKIAILDATLDCLANEGIDKVTLQEIGRRVKMRRSHVVYYYKSVPEMLEDAMGLVLATGQEITVAFLSNIKEPEKLLEAYVEATFAWFHLHPEHSTAFYLMFHYASLLPSYRQKLTDLKNNSETRIQNILRLNLKGRKKKVSEKKIAETAHCIRGLLVGNLLDYFTTQSPMSYPELRQVTWEGIRSLAEAL